MVINRDPKLLTMNLVFFLGGADLEMATIRALVDEVMPGHVYDKGLSWGAKTSSYRDEIKEALRAGRTPVLVELQDDLGLDPDRIVVVDHHGQKAGADQPTSLHQVFKLLGLPPERWSRWYDLVAANDRGHVAELRWIGATREEIIEVRKADRRAQRITEQEECAGDQAVAMAETHAREALTVVRLPHNRTAVVTDRMDRTLGGPGFRNLLVLSPGEVNFYGSGDLIAALNAHFPDGWCGGALPERGFWGKLGDGDDAMQFLIERTERIESKPTVLGVQPGQSCLNNKEPGAVVETKRRGR